MAKFSNPSKLSKREQEQLIIRLCQAICSIKNPIEAAEFLKDILSVQEVEMIAKRLKVAELLMEGRTYSQISADLKVSPSTISRVYEWLKISGDGFKLVFERLPNEEKGGGKIANDSLEEKFNPFSWRNVKRKYPLYFWPQLLLEQVVHSAKQDDRKKFRAILKDMNKKSALYKQLSKILSGQYQTQYKKKRNF